MNSEYENGRDSGYFHGLNVSLLEVAKADNLYDAMDRLTALIKGAPL